MLGYCYVKLREAQRGMLPYRRSWTDTSVVHTGRPTVHMLAYPSEAAQNEPDQIDAVKLEDQSDLEIFQAGHQDVPPPLPQPYHANSKYKDCIVFGGYMFNQIQFRILQLVPQNIPAKRVDRDYYYRELKNVYYPNRSISSAKILLEVYSGMRRHDPFLFGVVRDGQLVAARTKELRKMLIDWLIMMEINKTQNYTFIDYERQVL